MKKKRFSVEQIVAAEKLYTFKINRLYTIGRNIPMPSEEDIEISMRLDGCAKCNLRYVSGEAPA